MSERKGYYFAYGFTMDERSMHTKCKGALLIGKGELDGYKFLINSKGYATIVQSHKAKIYGLIWSITRSDESRLDRYEDVANNLYYKAHRLICSIDGKNKRVNEQFRALLYIATSNKIGKARKTYIEKIISAAKAHRLPKNYIKTIEAWI